VISGQARRGRSLVTELLQMQDKPLLLVDIDGVISPRGSASNVRPAGPFHNLDGVIHLLSAEAGIHLLSLAERFDLVWRSGGRRRLRSICRTRSPYPLGGRFSRSGRDPARNHADCTRAALDAARADELMAWAAGVAGAA
jgi:hypothetical protein